MKTSARFLAMLLAVVMVASAALSVSAFSDVTAATEHASAISVLNQLGVIGGYEDGTFKPEKEVTRAEMAKLVYVLYTTFQDAGKGSVKFDDVAEDFWATGFISWCFNKNIIGGFGNGTFKPTANVTYDQALKMVCGTLGYNEWDSALWPVDVRSKALNELDLGKGIADDVKGDQALTRGQVAQIMYNALFVKMAETKTQTVNVQGYPVQIPVAKVLATDVWGFTENTYKIADVADKSLDLEKLDEEGNTVDTVTMTLEELGLEAYENRTADLKDLHIATIANSKDGKLLGAANIKGSVVDNVSFTYAGKLIKIDGVEYTAKNFDGKNDDDIKFVNGGDVFAKADNATTDDKKDNLAKAFINTYAKVAKVVRTYDYDGDGKIDAFQIFPKGAYEVTSIGNGKDAAGNAVKVVNAAILNGNATLKVNVPDVVGAELKKGDIFVGAQVSYKLYAEVVEPVKDVATEIITTAGKVVLKDNGTVKYTGQTVAGAEVISLDANSLTAKDPMTFYIYNGEIISSNAIASNEYNFGVLVSVENDTNSTFNPETMRDEAKVIATIRVLEEGKLVEKKVTLSKIDFGGTEIAASAAVNNPNFKFDVEPDKITVEGQLVDNPKAGMRVYKYHVLANIVEEEEGYVLTINADYDDVVADPTSADNTIVISAGATIAYDSEKTLYTVTAADSTKYSKVVIDDASVFFYKNELETGSAKGFIDLAAYTKANITAKDFSEATAGETYLIKNADGRYVLVATLLDKEISAIDPSAVDFTKKGSLILYAPADSSVVAEDGKQYNKYTFLDLTTFEAKAPEVDKENVYHATTNKGAVKNGLYGINNAGKYVQVTKNDTFASVAYGKLTDVYAAYDLIEVASNDVAIGEKVTIWGINSKADADKETYVTYTIEELEAMFNLVKTYNEDKVAEYAELDVNKDEDPANDVAWTNLEIQVLVLKDINADQKYDVTSVIVEVFEADEDGVVESLNSEIFKVYNK